MTKFNKIRTSIPAFFKALKNKNTPVPAKIAVAVAIAYAFMPADVVVDAIPFLGWFDDALIMTVLFAIANKMIPDYVMDKEKNEIIDDVNYEVMD
ncbi:MULTISPECIES: DUF1232 domain-containing protein [Anaerococcus]|uniref:DUF1232 domain-containing protein n=1 Tax=Anaerococcus octavius TaxID=54007 RepID=A0A2I1MC07_9FIRM|nr:MULTISPECIES: DUF1232 domain-containing protein [Anaerococcus]MBS6105162.1 DUF1232 domain-containing protein [Anaerococcus sp.]PKZ17609.1 hypothetical protein CYJ34_02555 [Anaerococcus octavius]